MIGLIWRAIRTVFLVVYVLHRLVWAIILDSLANHYKRHIGPEPKPNPFLSGNYAPIGDELTTGALPIRGKLPADLDGQFVRTGPNARWNNNPKKDLHYHWFDGDGMLHGVLLHNGKATYLNRYVRTARFLHEELAQRGVYIRLGELCTLRGFLRLSGRIAWALISRARPNVSNGTANTALEFHNGRLLALVENDHPYHVNAPDLKTVGRYDYDRKLKHPFTAHPKVDAKTGEMMFFGYSIQDKPYIHYSVVSAEGQLLRTVPVDLPVAIMMHDFAVTEHYSLLLDLPFTFRPERVLGRQSPFKFEPDRPSRYGFMRRHINNQKEIQWLQGPAGFLFHVLNCYEETDRHVVMYACRSDRTNSIGLEPGTAHTYDPSVLPYLHRWDFDLENDKVTETQLSSFSCEFPRINEAYIGYKHRYGYVMRSKSGTTNFMLDAIVKIDFGTGKEPLKMTTVELAEDESAGECVFVPRDNASSEDDGYLMTFIYNSRTNSSEYVVLDAKNMVEVNRVSPQQQASVPSNKNKKQKEKEQSAKQQSEEQGDAQVEAPFLCRIPIPRRVPYGFHGKWVSWQQITQQRQEL